MGTTPSPPEKKQAGGLLQLKETLACSVCGSAGIEFRWLSPNNTDPNLAGPYRIFQCGCCGIGMTVPVPGWEKMKESYDSGIYLHGGGRIPFVEMVLNALHLLRLKEMRRFRRPPGKLLDIGCGKGRFVACARDKGWQSQGIEAAHAQAAAARRRYGIEVLEGTIERATLENDSYDVVTAWHVLEHLSDPHPLFVQVRRILRPGGLFVCEVPNFDSWQARIGREHWFHQDVPRHLVHYTPRGLRGLLQRYGLDVLQERTFSFEHGPFGLLQTILNHTGLPPNWFYRWLKRSIPGGHRLLLALHLGLVAPLGPLAFLLESLAAWPGRGGVIRMLAVLRDRP